MEIRRANAEQPDKPKPHEPEQPVSHAPGSAPAEGPGGAEAEADAPPDHSWGEVTERQIRELRNQAHRELDGLLDTLWAFMEGTTDSAPPRRKLTELLRVVDAVSLVPTRQGEGSTANGLLGWMLTNEIADYLAATRELTHSDQEKVAAMAHGAAVTLIFGEALANTQAGANCVFAGLDLEHLARGQSGPNFVKSLAGRGRPRKEDMHHVDRAELRSARLVIA